MTKKPRIAIIHCSFIYTGGGERIVFGQIEGLKKRGYEVECFTPALDKKRCYPDIIEQYEIKTFLPSLPEWVPFRHAFSMLATSALAPLFAPKFRKFDLIIGANQPGAWFAFIIARILRKPHLIYTCHPNKMVYPRNLSRGQIWKTQPDFYWLSFILDAFKPLVSFLDKRSFQSSKGRVFINGFYIGREFKKIYRIPWLGCPCGVSVVEESALSKNPKEAFSGSLKINGHYIQKPYVLFVGRHEAWKRIDWAIEAFKKVIDEGVTASLIVPGPHGPHTAELQTLAKNLRISSRVFFPGEVDQKELARLYKEAAVFIFPSEKEDFGIVMLEAMGYGVPVVAWNAAGPTDIVVDGGTGFLVEPYNLDGFAARVLELLNDPDKRLKMGRRAWSHARQNFSWDKHLNILENEFHEVMKSGGNRTIED